MSDLAQPVVCPEQWDIVNPLDPSDIEGEDMAFRLNALGSLYFFTKFILKRTRLTETLHEPIATRLESQRLNYLLELPRDHFKSTLVTEALPIWWSLPFTDRDEGAMRGLGYGDEWINWMKFAHNPQIRILIVSEAGMNAMKLGMRIDAHFESNSLFRDYFPEILPNTSCVWNSETKHVRHTGFHAHGEGTFDFLGVGGALQSRHYDRIIEDDTVGKEALKSEVVMNDTIDYHRLLEGAFDGPDHTELVVGNRWNPWDLNRWIRDNEPEFIIESHSALGGCCDQHPPGVPIFPEEFSVERLERIRRRQGPYIFAHQFLNQEVMPEEVVFNKDWLRFYAPKEDKMTKRMLLTHEPAEGTVYRDIPASFLQRSMIVDPNHAGEQGRARHAIIVTGYDGDKDHIYLLDLWAQSMPYDDLMANVYRLADRWKMTEFWLETVAAQRYLKYHIEYRNRVESRLLRVRELKTDRSKNAKWTRIDALSPLFEQGKVFVRRDQSAFLDEFYRYSHSTKHTVDILDALGYAPQTWYATRNRELFKAREQRREQRVARRTFTGY